MKAISFNFKRIAIAAILLYLFLPLIIYSQSPIVFPASAYNMSDFTLPPANYDDCTNSIIRLGVPGKINIGGSPITVIDPHDVVMTAGTEIVIRPQTTVSNHCPNSSGSLFRIGNFSCAVKIMNVTTGSVLKNEKLELGIKLQPDELSAIDNYFTNAHPSDPKINPYNPDDIDVVAHFVSASGGQIDINGFYYRDYTEDPYPGTNDWIENPNDYPFRVRFSPNKTGLWEVSINVNSSIMSTTGLTIDPNCSVTSGPNHGFNCDPNQNNLGPLEVGAHKKNLRFRDFQSSGDHKSFFAIGENIEEPWSRFGESVLKLDEYEHIQNGMSEIHNAGANTMRLFTSSWTWSPQSHVFNQSPWNTTNPLPWYISRSGILGDYDSRQPQMYELDKTLNMLHGWNMYTILDLFSYVDISNPGVYGPGSFLADWGNSPYNSLNQSVIPGINDQFDFYKSTDCRNYIKRQIRYFISRWGYDSNILCYEICNEIDNINTQYTANPTKLGITYRMLIDSWQREMASYIKQHDYYNHLVTTNYAWKPLPPQDHIFDDNNIDLLTIHSYWQSYNVDRTTRVDQIRNTLDVFPDKPIIDDEGGCSDPGMFEEQTNSPFHNFIWSSSFEGGFGTSLEFWWDFINDIHGQTHFTALVDFMSDVDFEKHDFIPLDNNNTSPVDARLSINPDPQGCEGRLEFHALRNTAKTRSCGWVTNRTVYWGNLVTPAGHANDETIDACSPGGIQVVNDPTDNFKETITIPSMGINKIFLVDWFVPGNTALSFFSTETITTTSDDLILTPPRTDLIRPDFAFKIRQDGTGPFRIKNNATQENVALSNSVHIYPNPSHNKITVECIESNRVMKQIRLTDLLGSTVLNLDNINTNQKEIDISRFSTGVYFINIIMDNDKIEIRKIIKN